jgi:hypothetical protein
LSEIRTDTISAANGTDPVTLTKQSAAKAWLCHNAGTVRDSFNHSSITDNGTGNFTITITSSMSNSDYVVAGTNGNSYHSYNNVAAANQYVNYAADNSHAGYDDPQMKSAVHGDLA